MAPSLVVLALVAATQTSLAAPPPGPAPTPDEAGLQARPPLWEVSRLAAQIRLDMQHSPPDALLQFVFATRERLVLSNEGDAVERAVDLELALRLGTAAQLLNGTDVAKNAPWFPEALRQTAYLLHAIGHRYETLDEVRFAIDSLAGDAGGAGAMLVDAVRVMRRYGADWLRELVAERAQAGPLDAASLHQRGLVELHEGSTAKASETLTAALALAPDRELAASACEALLAVGHPKVRALAETLRDEMVKVLPGLAGIFAQCFEHDADLAATRAFEERDGLAKDDAPELVAQVERYLRLGRNGAAELIAKALVERFPTLPEALHVLATLYFRLDRWESLRTLLAEVERTGRMDARLGEIRLAARVGLALQASMGAAPHPLAEGDVAAEVKASKGPPLVRHAQTILLALARWLGSKQGSAAGTQATPAKEAAAIIEAEVKAVLANHGKEADGLRLALVSMVALERLDEGLALIAPKLKKLPAPQQAAMRALVARVELGEALRRRDTKRLDQAQMLVREAQRGQLDAADRAELLLASLVAELATPTLMGATIERDPLNAIRAKLVGLAWSFDTTTAQGRGAEQARLMSLATGDALGADEESARIHLRAARRVKDSAVGRLAGGLAMLMIGDGHAAAELCGRVAPGEKPGLAQAIAICLASGLSQSGQDAKAAWREVLALWSDAGVPTKLPLGAVRPVFGGEFDIGVTVLHGKPLALALNARPLALALPELVQDKASIEELAR